MLAACTLALGLSASTAVFTYTNAYNRPFPGARVDGVFQLFQSSEVVPYGPISYPDFLDLAEAGEDRLEVAGSGPSLFAASVRHEALTEVVFGQSVTGNYFPVLQVEMSAGRWLSPNDDRPGAPPAVVISHEYWARRYGTDAGVLGRTILLNNRPHTIVGVAGPSFLGSNATFRPQVWMPFEPYKEVYWARSETETSREAGVVTPFLRPDPGLNETAVEQALVALAASLDQEAPLAERTRRWFMEPATWIPPQIREAEAPTTRIMLFAAAGLLLLACANMANLVLSAGARRGQEMAVRSAVGAARGRLVRQLLAENVLLSLLAGGVALAVAGPAANRLSSYFARPSVWGANVPREISIDPRVLAVATLTAVLAGVLAGIIPALRTSTRDPASALKAGGRGSSGRSSGSRRRIFGTRDLLVSVQVALSIVLLFLAGLVLRTLNSAGNVDPGFNTQWTLASYISTSSMGTPAEERHAFYRELVRRFEEMPWVQAATVAEQAPLSGHPIQELTADGVEEPIPVVIARVVPGYFETMEMPLVRGRSFLPTDTAGAEGVVVVNETLAGRLPGDGNGVGAILRLPGNGKGPEQAFQVVGVARNARQTTLLDEPGPVAYFSYPQHYSPPGNAFLLKVNGNPLVAVQRMEEELHAVDPRIAIVNILPYSQVVSGFLYTQRMNAELFTVIAVLGLILLAAGIFGVVSLAVARRRMEIGIRLALGADTGAIVRVAAARVLASLLLGLGAGLAAAMLATRLVETLTWGISPTDPISLVGGLGVLMGAVVLAMSVPILRALRIDPVGSLKTE
jgi:putative ABC transport system permease protein